jgi:hypothetical protein
MKKMNKLKYIVGMLLGVFLYTSCSNLDESEFNLTTTGETLLYSEAFDTDLGDFTAMSTVGDTAWWYSSSYTCAYMTGYVGGSKTAQTSWLISPEVDLSSVSSAYFYFSHAGRYFSTPTSEATVWVSADYSDDLNPNSATWTQVTVPNYFSNSDFTFVNTGDISLTAFAGQKIHIALKYSSTSSSAGTWEVKNFFVYSGEATVEENTDGEGTEDSPYTVAGAISNQTSSSAWVQGYIVGYVVSGDEIQYIFNSDTCSVSTNVLIADTTTGFYVSQCMAVQLPSGAVRTGVNLVDNTTNIGKKVSLYGTLSSYFGAAGLKAVSYYKFEDGTSGGTKPVEAIFSETFANSSQGNFTIQNVNLPSALSYIWIPTSSYGMKATAYYNSTNYDSESWLISPEIDLTGVTLPYLSFDYVTRYFTAPASDVSIMVSTDYVSGLPSTGTWTQIPFAFTNFSSWTFQNTSAIDISSVAAGKKIRIGFKYTSTSSKAGTWEIKNLLLYKE